MKVDRPVPMSMSNIVEASAQAEQRRLQYGCIRCNGNDEPTKHAGISGLIAGSPLH